MIFIYRLIQETFCCVKKKRLHANLYDSARQVKTICQKKIFFFFFIFIKQKFSTNFNY
jgi:hypothetical protein